MFKKSIRINKEANWSLTINYFIGKRLDKNTIRSALRTIQRHTCLSFNESSKREENKDQLVYLRSTSACSALTGKNRRNNPVNLTRECSKNFGIVIHESCHALGLRHEHQRIDRDRYITILKENIPQGFYSNIMTLDDKGKYTFFNISYDYASVMHYPSILDNSNGKTVIKVKNIDPYNKMLGHKVGLSFNDLKLLNYYYCMKDCSEGKRDCKNGGYVKQPNCYTCICPKGYKGFDCTEA
uniref:Metalloendopeptidase n=1 Tax=Parastrongyloides trichosuri TaxID=131310 RepID=A0A0N4ZCW6_PARTI